MSTASGPASTPVPARPARRGIRFGLVSLVFAIVAPVWLVSGVYLALLSSGHDLPGDQQSVPGAASVAVYVFVFTGYFVVPVLFILAVVFAIIAIVRNLPRGRAMGVAALGVIALCGAGIVVLVVVFLLGLAGFS